MSDTSLHTFPKNKYDALTMLYLEKQDLSNLTPEEYLDKYDEVYKKISDYYRSQRYK